MSSWWDKISSALPFFNSQTQACKNKKNVENDLNKKNSEAEKNRNTASIEEEKKRHEAAMKAIEEGLDCKPNTGKDTNTGQNTTIAVEKIFSKKCCCKISDMA